MQYLSSALTAPAGEHKIFRDPVHGDIALPHGLLRLLDTRQMQRLRGIKQLGTANLVYPGAVHTRFEHSLGTCGLAALMLDILQAQGHPISPADRYLILAAALVHDVGHIPYGHTIEDERRLFARHDSPQRLNQLLGSGDLGRELKAQGLTEGVKSVLLGTHPHPWFSEIISGTVCADLLDYLARDAFFCGLPGRYDLRLLRQLRVDDDHLYLDAQKNGIIREDIISEVINLLRLRYFLTERVFFHHTKTASGAMISRMVEQALAQGLKLPDLFPMTDERLLAMLEDRFSKDSVISRLLDSLYCRRIYKRAYILTRRVGEALESHLVERYHLHPSQRRQAEEALCRRLHLAPGELIIYCPAASMQMKEADVRVKTDLGAPHPLSDRDIPEVNALKARHRNLWRFYVFVAPERQDKLGKISSACEEYFGCENHLPALQSAQMFMGI